MPLRRMITVIIVSVLQSMELRLGEAEGFAWSDLQSWDQNPGASGVISQRQISSGTANNSQKKKWNDNYNKS